MYRWSKTAAIVIGLLAVCMIGCGEDEATEETITGITQNSTVTVTFDDDPGHVTASDGTVRGSGNERTIPDFSHGPLDLTISWTNKGINIIERRTETVDIVPSSIGGVTPPPSDITLPTRDTDCKVGNIIQPGESCTYPGTDATLSVFEDGTAQFLLFTAGGDIRIENASINGKRYTLVAVKRDDGSREIIKVGE